MITEDYVSFEVAKLLKEKGFEGDINAYYHIWDNGNRVCSVREFTHSEAPYLYIPAPTHQMALKWLREVYHIFIFIDYVIPTKLSFEYTYEIYNMINGRSMAVSAFRDDYETYEEAVEAAIKYCLTNLI